MSEHKHDRYCDCQRAPRKDMMHCIIFPEEALMWEFELNIAGFRLTQQAPEPRRRILGLSAPRMVASRTLDQDARGTEEAAAI